MSLVSFSLARAAEYRVGVGDVLEVSATNIADFRHRVSVGADGNATFPLVGMIPARDKTSAGPAQARCGWQ
jgi:protein involved in polysaccharide export with SLBB domain